MAAHVLLLLDAYARRDKVDVQEYLHKLIDGPRATRALLVALALLAGKPLAEHTGVGVDPWVVQAPDGAPNPADHEFLTARLVAGGANKDAMAVGKVAELCVTIGPELAIEVLLNLLRMIDIQGHRGDYNAALGTPWS